MKTTTTIFLIALLTSCVPQASTPGNGCLPDILKLEAESANCNEAQLKVDILLRYSSSCKEVFGDSGFIVCGKLIKDAGHERQD